MTTHTWNEVFDYRALRLLLGVIAFTLPFLVTWIAKTDPAFTAELKSISASYYTNARDTFVGLLFVVSAFLWAYNGHTLKEKFASKAASLAAVLVALFPTACIGCKSDLRSMIHTFAAVGLFSILAYFCFGPFRKNTKGRGGKKGRRSKIYFACGCVMILGMLLGATTFIPQLEAYSERFSLLFWGEAIALGAFGVAWITAGKVIPILVDKEEALPLFR